MGLTTVHVRPIPYAIWCAYGRQNELAVHGSHSALVGEWAARIRAGLWESR